MKANFDKIINDARPVVVDFHALWCNPCTVQAPILMDLASEPGKTALQVGKNISFPW